MAEDKVQPVLGLVLAFPLSPDGPSDDTQMMSFVPSDPASFGVQLQILVGDREGGRQDSFDVIVCTPAWLASGRYDLSEHAIAGGPVVPGSGLWLVDSWDPAGIDGTIRALLSAATAADWPHLANWLGRFAPWEFAYRFDRDHGVTVDVETVYPQSRDSE